MTTSLTSRIYKRQKNSEVCFQFKSDRITHTSDWSFSTGRGGVKKHILFRFGQDFKEALNQSHYKHTIPVEVSLERLEIRHKCCYLPRLAQVAVRRLDKEPSAKCHLGEWKTTKQALCEGRCCETMRAFPELCHVERQHLLPREKVATRWTHPGQRTNIQCNFPVVTRGAEVTGVSRRAVLTERHFDYSLCNNLYLQLILF